jgi:hypothetical protein
MWINTLLKRRRNCGITIITIISLATLSILYINHNEYYRDPDYQYLIGHDYNGNVLSTIVDQRFVSDDDIDQYLSYFFVRNNTCEKIICE